MTNMATICTFFLAFLPLATPEATEVVKPIDRILRVTTLAAKGPGSLREALEAKGPRLVVFEVGGVIDLAGTSLAVRNPDVILAGQTAPDPGITLIRGGLVVQTHGVVVQHLAVRPGDEAGGPVDAISAHGPEAHDVVFDHCSATWGIDENLSVSGPGDAKPGQTAHDVTIRSCLIAEGLSHAKHPKGEHSKGTLLHDGVRGVTITGSLFALNRERNPRLKGGTRAVIAGNVMYGWAAACIGVGAHGNKEQLEPAEAVVVSNTAIAGPETRGKVFVKSVDPGGRVYLHGNAVTVPLADDGVVQLDAPPSWARIPSSLPSADEVLRTAGARPARRDPVDARIVELVRRREGRIIDSQNDAGGYPVRPATARPLVVPEGREARQRWLDKMAAELEGH